MVRLGLIALGAALLVAGPGASAAADDAQPNKIASGEDELCSAAPIAGGFGNPFRVPIIHLSRACSAA